MVISFQNLSLPGHPPAPQEPPQGLDFINYRGSKPLLNHLQDFEVLKVHIRVSQNASPGLWRGRC